MKSLLSEIRRRNVLRVGALYLVSAWLIAQVADVVIGLGEFPPSIGRVVLVILAMGFPVALVASWLFEWTPAGIRREGELSAEGVADPVSQPSSGRRMDYVIISLLSVALLYFVINHDWRGPPRVSGASIAVLPFENRSAEADDLYFTDGIHEDILTQLGKISSMVVISRTSVMRYRDSLKTIPEIASELGVANILEGGVQRAGNRVRINLQLIDAAGDKHLWAETYDRELSVDNVFAIQSEIATSIASALHARLLPQELARIETPPTHNLEAYDAYLLGRRQMASRDVVELDKGRAFFKRAIELDPQFALAYTGLATTSGLLAEYGEGDPGPLLDEAEAAAARALELDPGLGEAHSAYGLIQWFKGSPPETFAPYLERGVELSPGSADVHKWYANYLGESNRREESIEALFKAVRLDPMSPIVRVNLADSLNSVGRVQEAEAQIERALEIDPRFMPAVVGLAGIAAPDRAMQLYSRAYLSNPNNPWVVMEMALGYLKLLEVERAERWAEQLGRIAPDSLQAWIVGLNLGLYRGDRPEAVKYAEKVVVFEGGPITVPSRTLLLDDLQQGRHARALERYRQKYPELLRDEPQVAVSYPAAIDVAMLKMALGETEAANRLLETTLAAMQADHQWSDKDSAIIEARAYALLDRPDEAIAALDRAIDAGWRFQWWFFLDHDPVFDSMRDGVRFQQLVARMEALVQAEREAVRRLEAAGEIALPPDHRTAREG